MHLTANYYLHHTYTLVPRHVREDMQWIADVGTDTISITVIEADLHAAKNNLLIICKEAERVGMTIHAVPSRWGSLFAGAPKVPSLYSCEHPETWNLKPDGKPNYFFGPVMSVHHPKTIEFFETNLTLLLKQFPITGIVWDEPKAISMTPDGQAAKADYSPAAVAKMNGQKVPGTWHIDAFANFVDHLGAFAQSINPKVVLSMFVYGNMEGYPLNRMAKIPHLDFFGCDGKPWSFADLPEEAEGELAKALIDQGPIFLKAARENGKGGLFLIENHNMPDWGAKIIDRRLQDVLALKPESLMYYYYPRNLSDPDRDMNILAKHLRTFK